jgi:hypothetical protein
MRSTISVRLDIDLAEWLRATAAKSGVTQGRIVRDQLEKARKREQAAFMRLAGSVDGPAGLSERKGFSRK